MIIPMQRESPRLVEAMTKGSKIDYDPSSLIVSKPLLQNFLPRNRDSNSSLGIDWVPTPYTVVVGRLKTREHTVGNQRLQAICQRYLESYSGASSKFEKSTLVSRIVETVQESCPKGAFVRYEKGRWWEVDDQ